MIAVCYTLEGESKEYTNNFCSYECGTVLLDTLQSRNGKEEWQGGTIETTRSFG
tara:strand:- start:1499 stop:1660 length:162 start_codon:yes stop_codon:yes gene_type:complete